MLVDEINRSIIKKYKDLSFPDYSFIQDSLDLKNIYSQVIEKLIDSGFKINDDTDLNEMVCEYYYLSKSKKQYSLLLSYVGLYAILLKMEKREMIVITDPIKNIEEKEILEILAHYKIKLLPQEILDLSIDFNPRHEVDYDEATIYNLLFTEDIPAWKFNKRKIEN